MNQLSLDLQPVQEYRTIQLTKGQSVKVDSEDFDWLSKWKWHAWWSEFTGSYYAVRSSRVGEFPKRLQIGMHRQITGALGTDHANKDTLDNRRRNLRPASKSQNGCNKRISQRNRSGFKGVGFHLAKGRWRSRITVAGKRKTIGYFATPEDAYEGYKIAAVKYHGEFAHF